MIQRRGFLSSMMAAPLASGLKPADAITANDFNVGPKDVLCFVVEPSFMFDMADAEELGKRLDVIARVLGMPREQLIIMHGVRPYLIKADAE